MKVVVMDPLELRVMLRDVAEQSVRKVLSESGIMGAIGAKEDLLTIEEAAKLLGLAKSTLSRLKATDEIPWLKRRRRLYFRRSELLQWVAESRKGKQDANNAATSKSELV